jgi:exodeoxyribonuclease V beta subunit
MARALRDWRIPWVAQVRDSVYANPAVADLAHLLRALLDGGERAFAGAMALPLFGLPLAQLVAARAQAGAGAGWTLREALRECWRERGPLALVLRLLAEVAPRWIGESEGPRRHADLLQVGELMESQRAAGAGMDAELGSLEARRNAALTGLASREERPRPLASDGAVRLLTTHAAKGLQFDIVFAPFLWRSRGAVRPDGEPPVQYHDASGNLRVDLGSPEMAAHREVQETEMLQEGLRQAYVALTRARHRCYTVWGRCRGMEQAPLAALLHPQLAPDGILPAAPDEATVVAALARLSHAGAGAIEVAALPRPEGPAPLPVVAAPELAAGPTPLSTTTAGIRRAWAIRWPRSGRLRPIRVARGSASACTWRWSGSISRNGPMPRGARAWTLPAVVSASARPSARCSRTGSGRRSTPPCCRGSPWRHSSRRRARASSNSISDLPARRAGWRRRLHWNRATRATRPRSRGCQRA